MNIILTTSPSLFELPNSETGEHGNHRIVLSARHDETNLYFDFEIHDEYVNSYGDKYNDMIWHGDTAELFFTRKDDPRYLELEVNPRGVRYAVLIDNHGKDDLRIIPLDAPPFTATTAYTPYGWTASYVVPKAALAGVGVDLDTCRFTATQFNHRPDESVEQYSLAPTMCDTFHVPETWARLSLI